MNFKLTTIILCLLIASSYADAHHSLAPYDIRNAIEITGVGRVYLDLLMKKMWYFVAAKRGMVESVPIRFKSFDEDKRYFYMTHRNLVDFLRDEEAAEKRRRQKWEADSGRDDLLGRVFSPSSLAELALFKKGDHDD